jgi:hypothetical protein
MSDVHARPPLPAHVLSQPLAHYQDQPAAGDDEPSATISSACAAAPPSQPANQTAVTAAPAAKKSRQTNGQPATTGRASAPSAEPASRPANKNTPPATAAGAASARPPSGDGGLDSSNDTVVPLNSRGYVVPPVVGLCRHCGTELMRKNRNGRLPKYCGGRCRVAAWRGRQKNKQ